MKRHHRIAVIIGLLNEDFPFAIHHKPPDIARPPADGRPRLGKLADGPIQKGHGFGPFTEVCQTLDQRSRVPAVQRAGKFPAPRFLEARAGDVPVSA